MAFCVESVLNRATLEDDLPVKVVGFAPTALLK